MDLDRLAFVALDRKGWLNLVVVALDGEKSGIDCYLPIAPHRRETGRRGSSSEEVRSIELGPGGAVVEMYGNAGVRTVHTVPVRGGCRTEWEHWGAAHAELNPTNEQTTPASWPSLGRCGRRAWEAGSYASGLGGSNLAAELTWVRQTR